MAPFFVSAFVAAARGDSGLCRMGHPPACSNAPRHPSPPMFVTMIRLLIHPMHKRMDDEYGEYYRRLVIF
jgi:hypothetical protein